MAVMLGKLWRRSEGSIVLEMGIVFPIFLGLVTGIADFGAAFAAKTQVEHAASAGARYAVLHGFISSKITTIVQNSSPLVIVTTPAGSPPTSFNGCPTATGIVAQTGSTCSRTGTAPGLYVTVTAQSSVSPIFPWPGFPSSFTASITVRIS